MGAEGIGPSTSVLSGQRSATELRAPIFKNNNKKNETSQKKEGHLRDGDP